MSFNHHLLAKTATDEVLGKFKRAEWSCLDGFGQDFYRISTNADFPSPDASFYDPTNKIIASFEFKPSTETKRGVLTGVGQCIAYLQHSDISFLVAPKMLGDFKLGNYLDDLYTNQISEHIPIGLILYENDNPSFVTLTQNITQLTRARVVRPAGRTTGRFWAKHQDLPLPLFHLVLHYYFQKKTNMLSSDPFAACWHERMISPTVLEDFQTIPILDISGKAIFTVAGRNEMRYLDKIIPQIMRQIPEGECRNNLANRIDSTFIGDNYFNSVKKNIVSFLRGMKTIDSENCLTDIGFGLYHIGLINGPTSKVFTDYFTKELLITGNHLDLILDFDAIHRNNSNTTLNTVLTLMEEDYEEKGYIQRNPNRQRAVRRTVEFLKFERILWKALDIVDANGNVNWKKITEICSLPSIC